MYLLYLYELPFREFFFVVKYEILNLLSERTARIYLPLERTTRMHQLLETFLQPVLFKCEISAPWQRLALPLSEPRKRCSASLTELDCRYFVLSVKNYKNIPAFRKNCKNVPSPSATSTPITAHPPGRSRFPASRKSEPAAQSRKFITLRECKHSLRYINFAASPLTNIYSYKKTANPKPLKKTAAKKSFNKTTAYIFSFRKVS